MRWPKLLRRNRAQFVDVDAKLRQAEGDLEVAKAAREEARELGEWATRENAANRFDLRLEAAYRLRRAGGQT